MPAEVRAARTAPQRHRAAKRRAARRVLVLDIGGSHAKLLVTGRRMPVKFPTGSKMTPAQLMREIRRVTQDWKYDAVSIGFPGPVIHGRIVSEPHNLGPGWVTFDFARAFQKPVAIVNDAAMQALGSYRGGRMLFMGLGTGLGMAMIADGVLEPMELAHLPYKDGRTYEDYVGFRGLERRGKKKWRRSVEKVVARFKQALQADDLVLGGGNIKYLKHVPAGARLGSNRNAFLGGFRLWSRDSRYAKTR
jgi:polyphosphate glucokinase